MLNSQTMLKDFNQPRLQNGFTLLEIIVVVAIIGTLVAVIGVSVTRDTNRLARLEAERFHIIVNEVRDEAILAGESYFLELNEDAGTFHFSPVVGEQHSAGNLLKTRRLEQGVELEWRVLDQVIISDEEQAQRKRALISAMGEITPFEARFSGEDSTYEVFIDDENQLARRERVRF